MDNWIHDSVAELDRMFNEARSAGSESVLATPALQQIEERLRDRFGPDKADRFRTLLNEEGISVAARLRNARDLVKHAPSVEARWRKHEVEMEARRKQERDLEEAQRRHAEEAHRRLQERRRTIREEVEKHMRGEEEAHYDHALHDFTQDRRITGLVHFTRIESLESITEYGLLSREACAALDLPCQDNDTMRLDGLHNHISLSVSWPNWQLFYRFQMNSKTSADNWCILVLDPNVIWTLDCLFAAENAAAARESGLRVEERRGVRGIQRLFDDTAASMHGLTRDQLRIPNNMPTCHQAEVLVKLRVPWDRTRRIVVHSTRALVAAQRVLPHRFHDLLEVTPALFGRRVDWKHWYDARERERHSSDLWLPAEHNGDFESEIPS